MRVHAIGNAIAIALAGTALSAPAADIVLAPPVGEGVSITNAAGNVTRFRVTDAGAITFPGLSAVPVPSTGLCVEIATGKVGTCTLPTSSGGTVTSVATGTGLTGGPITGSGTISADTSVLQARVGGTCPAGSSIRVIAADGSVTCQADGPANAFVQGGNAFASAAILGTTDDQGVTIVANNVAALRMMPNALSPNVVGGHSANSVTAGVAGAVVAGGGASGSVDPFGTTLYPCPGGSCGNRVTDSGGTVGGGAANQAGDAAGTTSDRIYATVLGGLANTASGAYSTVPGGWSNIASGSYSFAAGRWALTQTSGGTIHHGAFVWADSSFAQFRSTADNEFSARATGGVRFVTAIDIPGNPTAGVTLAAGGGAWAALSDVNAKADFAAVDSRLVLEKVAALPIRSWRYKAQDASIRHIGPTSQDFRAAFGVGESERTITTVDADGVALAAIQGLHQLVAEKERRIRELEHDRRRQELTAQRQAEEIASLKARTEWLARTLEGLAAGGTIRVAASP